VACPDISVPTMEVSALTSRTQRMKWTWTAENEIIFYPDLHTSLQNQTLTDA
jgi:hypothetical protein